MCSPEAATQLIRLPLTLLNLGCITQVSFVTQCSFVMPVERDATNPDSEVVRPANDAEVSLDEMLSLACRQGKQEIAELLMESGALVSRRNKSGNTPLLEACSQGYVQVSRFSSPFRFFRYNSLLCNL